MSYSRRPRDSRSPSPYKRGYSRSVSRSLSRSRSRSRDSSDVENPGNNLYVTGLSIRVTRRDVEKHFSTEGKVEDVHVVVDPLTRESRGFGFVTMSNLKEAERCIKHLDGSVLEGRVITVEKARRRRGRTPTPGRYLGLRAQAHARHRSRSRSRSYSPYRLRDRSPRHSSERDDRRSRSRSYSPHYSRRRRSYSPYGRRRSYSPPCDSYGRRSCSRSPSRDNSSPHYRYYRKRDCSPEYERYYSRGYRHRSITPPPRRRSYSPPYNSYGRSYSRSPSRDYSSSPENRYYGKRDYSPEYEPYYSRGYRYRSITPPPRHGRPYYRRRNSPCVSPRRRSRSCSRSAYLRRACSRSVSPERRASPPKSSNGGFGKRVPSFDSRTSRRHSRSPSASSFSHSSRSVDRSPSP